jgi:uncharacterized membrane protein YozB (DUF420 family)
MSSLGAVIEVVLAVVLLVAAAWLLRSRGVSPWPAIVVAAFTSGVCFTVGGDSARDASEPSVATIVAAIAGILTVVAAILALVPRVARPPFTRLPTLVASAAIVVGAVGLLVNRLVG